MRRSRLLIALAGLELFTTVSGMRAAHAVTIGAPQQVGTITSPTLKEVSGLAASRSLTDVLWVHNDSGDSARFFAISRQGSLLGTFPLSGATATDWEDVAIGPKSGGGNYLYLGDIGDNNSVRPYITVYRTDEPTSSAGSTIPASGYSAAKLQYPNGPRNAESLFVDPLSGDIYILSKSTSTQIYSAPASIFNDAGQTTVMTSMGNLGSKFSTATAADISPDGRFILVRSSSSTTGYLYERGPGQTIADALHGTGTPFPLGFELQGEAIGWAADGKSFFTTSEIPILTSAPIFAYSFASSDVTLLAGDYNDDHVVDAADYSVWRDQLGASVALPNEVETIGHVTIEDFDVWRAHFGESLGGVGATAVPESGTWWLLAIGCGVSSIGIRWMRSITPGSRPRAAAYPGACT